MGLAGAAVGAIGSIAGGLMQANAAKKAASGQRQAYRQMVQGVRDANNPWVEGGMKGFQGMQNMLTPGYQYGAQDPAYQWRTQQGLNALAAQSAAAGHYGSGNLGTALVNYGQDAASQEYGNTWNRNMQLANMGWQGNQNITNALTGQGQGVAQSYGNLGQQNAQAYGGMMSGVTNSLMGGLGNYMQGTQQANMLNTLMANNAVMNGIDPSKLQRFAGPGIW